MKTLLKTIQTNTCVVRSVRKQALQVALIGTVALLAGCGSLASKNSPDVIYSDNAVQARDLQVPPDLTDVSNAEQFVLPGTGNAAVARNTLLPQFDSLRFVREGGQHWLEFQQTPEDLWPRLLEFLRKEKFRIDQTEPVAGVIATQWRPASALAGTRILGLKGRGPVQGCLPVHRWLHKRLWRLPTVPIPSGLPHRMIRKAPVPC